MPCGTVIPFLYKHNFALFELAAIEVSAGMESCLASHSGTQAGCTFEGDPEDYQAQWQSLQLTHFIEDDGSVRAAGLS